MYTPTEEISQSNEENEIKNTEYHRSQSWACGFTLAAHTNGVKPSRKGRGSFIIQLPGEGSLTIGIK